MVSSLRHARLARLHRSRSEHVSGSFGPAGVRLTAPLGRVGDTWSVAENTIESTRGNCAFCGKATAFGAFSTKSRLGKQNPDGTFPVLPRPRCWMCDEHLRQYQRDELLIGWCESCITWGNPFTSSPCGEIFLPGA